MDLIAEIIKRKQAKPNDALEVIKNLITDIITYEKLAQNERFRDLSNPVVAKRCPHLYEATTAPSSYNAVMLRELLPVLISFTNRSFGTITLAEQSKRDQILNNSYNIHLRVSDGAFCPEEIDTKLVVKEMSGTNEDYLIIVAKNDTVDAYMFKDIKTSTPIAIEPYVKTNGPNTITIVSYSTLGNNDYVFGDIDGLPIRITEQQLVVGIEKITLDMASLSFMTKIEDIAEYLLAQYQQRSA